MEASLGSIDYLQRINICNRLKRIGNIYLEATRNFDHEINEILQHLGLENANTSNFRILRNTLREQQYEERGLGVSFF